jgi:signal transduction histidine kinase
MRVNRSVLIGITLAYLLSLFCGFLVATVISRESYAYYVTPTFEAMDQLELQEATGILAKDGPQALGIYLRHLDEAFGGRHFLLSPSGVNLANRGTQQASLIPKPPASRYRGYIHGIFHLAQRSNDGQVWFVVVGTANEQGPATWAYFLVCALVTTGLLVFSLFYLVFPLRRIRDAMVAFGRGEMGRRVPNRRQDEVGQLSKSFNAMAEQIERSFHSERALLQDVSHELRAPLARLSLAIHLAKAEHGDDLLSQIESNVQRLTSLVGEITAFHQTWSAAENDHPLEIVDLDQLVREVVRESTIEAAMHSVEIGVTSQRVVLRGARPDLITRVFGNILRNAILHTWQGSRIEVCLAEESGNAVLTVRDFGRGLAPDVLERIFEPFYREQSENGAAPGLGLGLSIARRGAQWHGGSLRAENADPGLRLIAVFPLRTSPLF